MRVLIAPGGLPGITAPAVARTLAAAWAGRSSDDVTRLALSDGAADLAEVVAAARGAARVPVTPRDPWGAPARGAVVLLDDAGGGTAVVDAGQAIGRVPAERRAVAALGGTSAGVGDLLDAALRTGATRLVIGLGPTAVHDGGSGMLRALAGAGHRDGEPAPWDLEAPGEGASPDLRPSLDTLAAAWARLATRDLILAYADDTPALGLAGAGATLARRTGVDPAAAQDRDRAVGAALEAVERWAAVRVPAATTLAFAERPAGAHRAGRLPGSGAGGGVAAALAALGGRLLPGADVVADLVGLQRAIARADLVLTAQARLSADALRSGVVATVAAAASRRGVPVVAIAPRIEVSRRELAEAGVVGAYPVDPPAGPFAPEGALAATPERRLADLGARLTATWSPRPNAPA